MSEKLFLSGNEAIALAAVDAGLALGTGYPGTPSSEILDEISRNGGRSQWAPNEKVALEVAIGAALAHGRAIATMKHVGLNVAADPLFTIAYSGTPGALVIVSADDPGMASSQNEQDNRRYAVAAGVPMLEPSDSQEAYDFTLRAFELSEKFRRPVLLRVTTRVCHSKCAVIRNRNVKAAPPIAYSKDAKSNVMIPAYAKIAHRKLRDTLREMADFNEKGDFVHEEMNDASLGIISAGISYAHSRDAAPQASFLKLGMTYPLPIERMRAFAAKVKRCIVIEEGDPVMTEAALAAGIKVEGKPEMYRFGELSVGRIRRIIAGDVSPEAPPVPGKPPQLCVGCPHRATFEILRDAGCIVSGDIGCYTLGVLPPFDAIDSCVCMGASITVGLGLRHVLAESEARRVVSVIGDSTFFHTGINGIVEMVYNRPATGHLVMILDNSTTAMTGMQENPGTGRKLDHTPAPQQSIEAIVKAIGVENVDVIDPVTQRKELETLIRRRLSEDKLSVIVARRTCIIAAAKSKG